MTTEVAVKTVLTRVLSAGAASCREVLAAAHRAQASTRPSKLNWRAPARSGLQCLVWLAAKGLASTVALGRATFELLTEASADVGAIFIRRHGGAA